MAERFRRQDVDRSGYLDAKELAVRAEEARRASTLAEAQARDIQEKQERERRDPDDNTSDDCTDTDPDPELLLLPLLI